jgi:hypothetical protein
MEAEDLDHRSLAATAFVTIAAIDNEGKSHRR